MNRKILSLLAAVACAAILVACGSSSGGSQTYKPSEPAVNTPAAPVAPTPQPTNASYPEIQAEVCKGISEGLSPSQMAAAIENASPNEDPNSIASAVESVAATCS